MSYRDMFNKDQDYQNKIKEFHRKKRRLEMMADQGIYNKNHLLQSSWQITNELRNFVKDYHSANIEKHQNMIDKLENTVKKIGYADRPNEAKEFEMRYKLADDYELRNMVQDLNSDNLLEINLLRLELKNRGMEQEDKQVKYYVMQNNIDGMDDIEKKEYENAKSKLSTFSTMGTNFIVAGDELVSIDIIEKNLQKAINKVDDNNPNARSINLDQF